MATCANLLYEWILFVGTNLYIRSVQIVPQRAILRKLHHKAIVGRIMDHSQVLKYRDILISNSQLG